MDFGNGVKKHYKKIEPVFLTIVLIDVILILWIKSLFFIMGNRDEIVFTCLLYDCIEYNGNAYYMAKKQHLSFGSSEERGPVYLVYKGSKIYYEPCNTARVYTGYEEAEEEVYIFFDSAEYIREDYRYIEDNQQ